MSGGGGGGGAGEGGEVDILFHHCRYRFTQQDDYSVLIVGDCDIFLTIKYGLSVHRCYLLDLLSTNQI